MDDVATGDVDELGGFAGFTDEELTALALAADPDAPIDDTVAPFGATGEVGGPLPAWYMPPAVASARDRTRRLVVAGIIGAFLVVNGAGLCVTSGFPQIAW